MPATFSDLETAFETLMSLIGLYKSYKSTKTQVIADRQATLLHLQIKGFLTFSDVRNEITSTFGDEIWHKFEDADTKINKILQIYVKIPLFRELMKKPDKSTNDFLQMFYRQVTLLPIIIRCLWVGKLSAIPFEELYKECPPLKDSGLNMSFEEHLILAKLLQERGTPKHLLNEIGYSLKAGDVHRISFMLFLFMEMLIDNQNAQAYSLKLQFGLWKKIRVNDGSDEGIALFEAKQALFNLLRADFNSVNRILKTFELFDSQESKAATFSDNYLSEPVEDQDLLMKELEALFPDEVTLVVLEDAWGVTHFSGDITLHSILFEGMLTNAQIIHIMLVILHELAHKKKYIHMSNQDYCYKTPDSVKRLYPDMYSETGCLLEKKGFGGRVYWKNVTEEIAEELLDVGKLTEEKWEEIALALTKKPSVKSGDEFSMMKSPKLLHVAPGCATERVRQSLKGISKSLFF